MAYQTSQGLASLGRNGDSVLVHMSPTEVAGLQGLAMSQGGSLTINPHTGLPEAFSLGGFFKSLLPVFVGAATGGAGMPLWAGIAAGAATGAATSKDPLMGALTGGLGGYGGFGLGQGLFAAGAPSAIPGAAGTAGVVGPTGQMGSSLLTASKGIAPGAASATANAAGNVYNLADTAVNTSGLAAGNVNPALANLKNVANTSGFTASAGTGATGVDKSFLGGMDRIGPGINQMGTGVKNIATGQEGAWDAFKNSFVEPGGKPLSDLAGYSKIAMPVGGAALGGLEPSDIYGEPIDMDAAKKKQAYDPNATLNLSGDTGLRLYATGGTIQSGGIRDLYGTPDNQPTISPGLSGFGLGRLNNLAGEQALNQAQTLGYAMGGPVSFADGGDSNKEDALGLPSLSPDMSMDPNAGASNLAMIQSAMQPTQGMQGNVPMTQGQMPDQSNDSLIAKVTANLKVDPNYQPENPIEAAIVKQIKGTDPMQQGQPSLQGLGSLGPAQPSQPMAPSYNPSQSMAPSFNPSVAMGPTYFAGINAPQGYAEGGETSLNLDELPTLNVETGKQSYNTIQSALANSDNPQGRLLNKLFSFRPGGGQSIYDQFAAKGLKRLNNSQMAKGGYLDGQGDGMSDSIPATIEGKQPARLSNSEFVIPADVVSHLGNGSSEAGSKRLYSMLDRVRKARTGNKKQGKEIKAEKYLPA
jgi:hypothetical protein